MRAWRGETPNSPVFEIDETLLNQIEAHLRAALPNEGCGMLAGSRRGSRIAAVRFFPGTNIDASPVRYTMNPSEVAAALEEIDRHGLTLCAIVHSHPAGPATPSRTDLREYHYPGTLMVIGDLSETGMVLRAWRVDPFMVEPLEVPVRTRPILPAETGTADRNEQ